MIESHIHGLLTHFPIVLLVLGVSFDSWARRYSEPHRAAARLLSVGGAISLAPAIVSGWFSMGATGQDFPLAGIHQGMALMLVFLGIGYTGYILGVHHGAWGSSRLLRRLLKASVMMLVVLIGLSGSVLRAELAEARPTPLDRHA